MTKNLVLKIEGGNLQKNVGSKKCWVPTNFLLQKSLGQSLSKKIKALKILAPKNFVKIRSVTAETFLIWTNVARTNAAWINVTLTVCVGGGVVCKAIFMSNPTLVELLLS